MMIIKQGGIKKNIKNKGHLLMFIWWVQLNERQKQHNRILFIGKHVVKLTPFC